MNRAKQIRDLATHVYKTLELTCPLNTNQLISDIGGTLEYADELPHSANFCIENTGETSFTLKLMRDECNENVVICQALGVMFINMGYLIDKDNTRWDSNKEYLNSVYTNMSYTEDMRYATIFAHNLLMPLTLFSQSIRNNTVNNKVTVDPIALEFGVPIDAVKSHGYACGRFRYVDEYSY